MRTLLFLVAALAAFLCAVPAQVPLFPHPSTSPTLAAAMAQPQTASWHWFSPAGATACPSSWAYCDRPFVQPLQAGYSYGTVHYGAAVEDVSQPNAANYLTVAVVWTGFTDFATPWASWTSPPWSGPGYWGPTSPLVSVPGTWAPCDLTFPLPASLTTVTVLPTYQDVGPTLGFPRYFIEWAFPAGNSLNGLTWWTCVQWATLHPNGTIRLSSVMNLPTY